MTSLLYNDNHICNDIKHLIDNYLHEDRQVVIQKNKTVLIKPLGLLDDCDGYLAHMILDGDFGDYKSIEIEGLDDQYFVYYDSFCVDLTESTFKNSLINKCDVFEGCVFMMNNHCSWCRYRRCIACKNGEGICNCSIKPSFVARYNFESSTDPGKHFKYCCNEHTDEMFEYMNHYVKSENYLAYDRDSEADIEKMIDHHKQNSWRN